MWCCDFLATFAKFERDAAALVRMLILPGTLGPLELSAQTPRAIVVGELTLAPARSTPPLHAIDARSLRQTLRAVQYAATW